MAFSMTSPAFSSGGVIPRQYTCDGADQSPPLAWSDLPTGTSSLYLVVEDPDASRGVFTHWVLFNLPPDPAELPAGQAKQTVLANGARHGRNDFRRGGYGGPCPPHGSVHHYVFRLFALDAPLKLTPGGPPSEIREAAAGHVLGAAELVGTYGR